MRSYLFFLFAIFLFIDRPIDGQLIDPPVPCKNDADCSMLAKKQKDPACHQGFCVCGDDKEQLKNCTSLNVILQQEKVTGSQVYHTCKLNMDCAFNNSFCNTTRYQCDCLKGFVPSMEKQQCLQVARSLNFPCTEDKQCLFFRANTTCHQQQCVCASGYHAVDDTCWKMAPFGSPCARLEECSHIKGAFCTDKKICGCGEKAVIDSTARNCIPFAQNINDYCFNNNVCSTIDNSICVNQRCQCLEDRHYVPELNRCIVSRGMGEPCQKDYDCYQVENDTHQAEKGIVCFGSLCDCAVNYFRNGDVCVSAGVPISFDLSLIAIVFWTIVYAFYRQ